MTGAILILTGIVILATGIIFLIISQKRMDKIVILEDQKKVPGLQNKKELDSLIVIAAADGVISKRERNIIIEKAKGLGIDIEIVEKKILFELEKTKQNAETKLIDRNKEKGDKFEAYIVAKFKKGYFSVKEWAGDKISEGIYAETTLHPDLKISLKANDVETEFAIECKFRSKYDNGGIEWAKESQLINYRKYEQKYKIPVFIAIGIGGKSEQPIELFIVPLKDINHTFLYRKFLQNYIKREHNEKPMYFNPKALTLK